MQGRQISLTFWSTKNISYINDQNLVNKISTIIMRNKYSRKSTDVAGWVLRLQN